jgi:Flp pilus assembly protein TadD
MKHLLAGTAALALCALWVPAATADDAPAQSTLKPLPSDVNTEVAKAQALRRAGKLTEAASALAQLMLVAPDDARVVGEYGKVMAQEHRGEDALAFLTRAVELQPNDWTLYSALGVAYDENNNPKAAAGAYQRALALKPGDATVLNNYAMSKMLAGDMTGAQMLFAQTQGTSDPRVANNAAMLAEIEAGRAPHAAPPRQQQVAAAPPPAKPQQTVAAAPLAKAPITVAALPAPASATKPTNTATGAPHSMMAATTSPANNPQVVMQAVPKDPLAGPVKPRVIAPHTRVARVATAEKKPMPATPALRTAADTH